MDLRDADIGCLDLLARGGPKSPSALAREWASIPQRLPASSIGSRRQSWIVRERDPADRRAVLVRALPKRAGELMGHYAGMNGAIDRICASYDARDLTVIAEFLERVTAAGREANTARVED